MGIDAQLYVQPAVKQSKQDLLRLSSRLYEASWGEPFYLFDDDNHIISAVKNSTIQQDGPSQKFDSQLLEVCLRGRYYGVGYERGNLPITTSICDWIEFNLPGCKIYYGGDSSGVCAGLFDKAEREKLLTHFYQHGHSPYRGAFGHGDGTCMCSRCHIPMNNRGGGGNVTFWSCGGCNEWAVGTNAANPEKRARGNENFSKAHQEIRSQQ